LKRDGFWTQDGDRGKQFWYVQTKMDKIALSRKKRNLRVSMVSKDKLEKLKFGQALPGSSAYPKAG